MKRDVLIQTVLRCKIPDATLQLTKFAEMTTWLPLDKHVKVGTVITLQGDDQKTKWTVHSQGARIESRLINRRWNVGGL